MTPTLPTVPLSTLLSAPDRDAAWARKLDGALCQALQDGDYPLSIFQSVPKLGRKSVLLWQLELSLWLSKLDPAVAQRLRNEPVLP